MVEVTPPIPSPNFSVSNNNSGSSSLPGNTGFSTNAPAVVNPTTPSLGHQNYAPLEAQCARQRSARAAVSSHDYSSLPPATTSNTAGNIRPAAKVGWRCGNHEPGQLSPPLRPVATSSCKTVRNLLFTATDEASPELDTQGGAPDGGGMTGQSAAYGKHTNGRRDGIGSDSPNNGLSTSGSDNPHRFPLVGNSQWLHPLAATEVLTTQSSKDASISPHVDNSTGCSPTSLRGTSHNHVSGLRLTAQPTEAAAPRESDRAGFSHEPGAGHVAGSDTITPPSFYGIRHYPLSRDNAETNSHAFDGTKEYCTPDGIFLDITILFCTMVTV